MEQGPLSRGFNYSIEDRYKFLNIQRLYNKLTDFEVFFFLYKINNLIDFQKF